MEVQPPDFEVILRVNASDVVVASGFLVSPDDIDCLLGVARVDHIPEYTKLLEYVLVGLNGASWKPLDDFDLYEDEGEGDDDAIPF